MNKCVKCGKDIVSPTTFWCTECFEKIDKSEWKTTKPHLFEYDSKNKVVDIFVRYDERCPFPFEDEDWFHQGFYLEEFIIYLRHFLANNTNYRIVEKNESVH